MTDCEDCPEGFFCPKVNTVVPQSCISGFDCTGGCTKSTPYLDTDCSGSPFTEDIPTNLPAFICPQGFYCNKNNTTGETKREPCPSGTYNEKYGATTIDWCLPCPSGQTCEEGTGVLDNDIINCWNGNYCYDGKIEPCPVRV